MPTPFSPSGAGGATLAGGGAAVAPCAPPAAGGVPAASAPPVPSPVPVPAAPFPVPVTGPAARRVVGPRRARHADGHRDGGSRHRHRRSGHHLPQVAARYFVHTSPSSPRSVSVTR
ncbi:hypothetical protein GCM10022244_47040 [Streptomyces gulbargensis]|uniref:Uncharacterized protein n=1 Tax=Streptomyces gulbargensis TaxID=364901 RepID=A0ABP7MZ09_9ACTN